MNVDKQDCSGNINYCIRFIKDILEHLFRFKIMAIIYLIKLF